MRQFLKSIKNEKWTIASLCLTAIGILTGVPFALGAEGTPTVKVVEGGAEAQPGNAGLNTQIPGQPTTVSAAASAGGNAGDGLVQPDIDELITEIGTDETVLDGLMRRCKRSVKVNSYEVDHYLIDEQKAAVELTAEYSGALEAETAELTMSTPDAKLMADCGTLIAKGVAGYTEDGQTPIPGSDLMLYIVGKNSSGMPIVRAINGPKSDPRNPYCNVPTIPDHTQLIVLSNACAETQKEVAPDMIIPEPKRVYLQKTVMNQVVSDYFDAQTKRIPFTEKVIAEAQVKRYRQKNNRTLWIGHKGKVMVDRGKMGAQTVYFTEGLRWKFKREWEHQGPWTFEDIIALAKMKFTGQNCSKKALWLMGRDLLEAIQNIDFTKHKDITMTSAKIWGFACTQLTTVFGDFYLLREPTLDYIGYSNSGALIDEEGLVRYFMKNEESSEEKVEGEEAKRKAIISINALELKGTTHIWVNCEGSSDGLPGVTVIKEHNHNTDAPAEPALNQIFYLKQACTGISGSQAGELWQWTGAEWKKYEGEIYAKDEAVKA